MNDVMKIIKSFEDSGLMIKGVSETIENETKKRWISWHVIRDTLESSLLGNLLIGKGVMRAGETMIRVGKGAIRAGQDF